MRREGGIGRERGEEGERERKEETEIIYGAYELVKEVVSVPNICFVNL